MEGTEQRSNQEGKCVMNPISRQQLYVHVKKRKTKRQYRRNQDAINFLRRFTLLVVIIDLILSLSESSLISTFFLFLTLSTTFDVKPENVIDTYCYQHKGEGSSLCEHYMERVTDYVATSRAGPINQHRRSASSNSVSGGDGRKSENFPTVTPRAPLSPSESRKLFLSFNQSLSEHPIRFSFQQKLEQDGKLSKLYARLVYLLFESQQGILKENSSMSEFLKMEDTPKMLMMQNLLVSQVTQSVEVIPASRAPVYIPGTGSSLIYPLCSKTLAKLKTLQRMKQRKPKVEKKRATPVPSGGGNGDGETLFRKQDLIEARDFVRHRWKRNTLIPSVPLLEENEEKGHGNVEKPQILVDVDRTRATGSTLDTQKNGNSGRADVKSDKQEKAAVRPTLSRSRSASRASGYRLVKTRNSNYKKEDFLDILMNEDFDWGLLESSKAKQVAPLVSSEWGKQDVPTILAEAEGNFNSILARNNSPVTDRPLISTLSPESGLNQHKSENDNILKGPTLADLMLDLNKSPRSYLSLMEVALFNSWQHLTESVKRVQLSYRIDDSDTTYEEESLAWLAVRKKIMEGLQMHMETNIFSKETLKKAELRKRAIEQIYHDYSNSILGELLTVKEISVSSTYQTIYWTIKGYVQIWLFSICMVLLYGSLFEDKAALNVWGVFNILTSFLHFMVDNWINTSFQPEKTSASIWFGVAYGFYKPVTILLVATLSSEIFKRDGRPRKGVISRFREICKGRQRPTLVLADKCLESLNGMCITPDECTTLPVGDTSGRKQNIQEGSAENNNGSIIYKGVRSVKIKARIKQLEIRNGNLVVITDEQKAVVQSCSHCASPTTGQRLSAGDNGENIYELRLFQPCVHDTEGRQVTQELYPDESDITDEGEDELEEVVDEDEDESDEEEERNMRQGQQVCNHEATSRKHVICQGLAKENKQSEIVFLSGKSLESVTPNDTSGLSVITGSDNLLQKGEILENHFLRGSVGDGDNLHM